MTKLDPTKSLRANHNQAIADGRVTPGEGEVLRTQILKDGKISAPELKQLAVQFDKATPKTAKEYAAFFADNNIPLDAGTKEKLANQYAMFEASVFGPIEQMYPTVKSIPKRALELPLLQALGGPARTLRFDPIGQAFFLTVSEGAVHPQLAKRTSTTYKIPADVVLHTNPPPLDRFTVVSNQIVALITAGLFGPDIAMAGPPAGFKAARHGSESDTLPGFTAVPLILQSANENHIAWVRNEDLAGNADAAPRFYLQTTTTIPHHAAPSWQDFTQRAIDDGPGRPDIHPVRPGSAAEKIQNLKSWIADATATHTSLGSSWEIANALRDREPIDLGSKNGEVLVAWVQLGMPGIQSGAADFILEHKPSLAPRAVHRHYTGSINALPSQPGWAGPA